MIPELGTFALALALAFSLAQIGLSVMARQTGVSTYRGAGEGAAAGAFFAVTVAFFALMTAFIQSDFSVMNVAQNSHSEKPLLYKIAGTWGSHEGSMVLWCLALTGFGAVIALTGRNLPWRLKSVAVAAQGALGVVFVAYTLFASNPFERIVNAPVEGSSLNPILQDPALAFHPPFLYLGYVGMSVVFSFAIAALIEGRVDAAWARWVRPWTLAAWSFLTVGIMLGAFWAYYELGWGGWWFWDSVENASFMPWLIATALLHSAMVTEKRGALKGWTVFLAIAAFTFSMFGTFLVRSGSIMSVHAFAVDPARGIALLSIMGLSAGVGYSLFAWRAPLFASGGLYAPVSRETTLVLNNIFLAAATATVLTGTLWPLVVEVATGTPASIGPPYFNMTFGPIMALCLIILPAAPLLAWKRGDAAGALQRLAVAGGLALVAGLLAFFLINPKGFLAGVGGAIGVWLVAGSLTELAVRSRVGKAGVGEVFRRLGGLPRGAWGMTLAHVGLGVFVLGACIQLSGKTETAEILLPGQSLQTGSYELTLNSVEPIEGPNYIADRASITARKNGELVCEGEPERRIYPDSRTNTTEVAICNQGLSHLYVVLNEPRETLDGQSGWKVTGYFYPWAWLIFVGPVLMALGGVVSLSDRRLRMGVAARTAKAERKPARPAKAAT